MKKKIADTVSGLALAASLPLFAMYAWAGWHVISRFCSKLSMYVTHVYVQTCC